MPIRPNLAPTAAPTPTLAISMGDPLGIGPEIIVKSLADPDRRRRSAYIIHGLDAPLRRAAVAASISPFWLVAAPATTPSHPLRPADVLLVQDPALARDFELAHPAPPPPPPPPTPTALSGHASIAFLERAIESTTLPLSHPHHADALVTAPISKTAWNLAGFTTYPGHTELLAHRYNAPRHAMLFVGRSMRVLLVTIHIPLSRVPDAITTPAVLTSIELGHDACRLLGIPHPRIAVCGLNPHAGEHGLLGDEDDRHIRPAIQLAAARGIHAAGPFPADALFLRAARGDYDLVVAMYHDQGLIPIKLLEREHTVNMTVGLPHPRLPGRWLIRTSPAHGTAFDIAGANLASATSMSAAIDLALASLVLPNGALPFR